jgi:hypothetical protein
MERKSAKRVAWLGLSTTQILPRTRTTNSLSFLQGEVPRTEGPANGPVRGLGLGLPLAMRRSGT